MRAGGNGRVRGPGEVCACGGSCVGDRPPSGAGRDVGEEKERERGTVGEKEKMDTTNGIRCWNGERSWEGIGFRDN